MEVQLISSRDGIRWDHTNKRKPFLSPRGAGYWDAYMNSIVSAPIEFEDKLYFFHGGSSCHDDWWFTNEKFDRSDCDQLENLRFGLGVAELRKDGYCSLHANKYRDGVVVTRPLMSLGEELVINARCLQDGYIKVEIVDRNENIIGDCSKENCDVFAEDSVRHKVTWQGSSFIPSGQENNAYWRKIRFYLKNAEIFSFHFAGKEAADTKSKQGTGV